MNDLTIGIVVLVVVSGVIGLAMALALRNARSEGLQGGALLRRLTPYLIADVVFTLVWVVWFLSSL